MDHFNDLPPGQYIDMQFKLSTSRLNHLLSLINAWSGSVQNTFVTWFPGDTHPLIEEDSDDDPGDDGGDDPGNDGGDDLGNHGHDNGHDNGPGDYENGQDDDENGQGPQGVVPNPVSNGIHAHEITTDEDADYLPPAGKKRKRKISDKKKKKKRQRRPFPNTNFPWLHRR